MLERRPPHLSLVIPAFNEQGYLPPLLDSIDAARDAYGRGRDAVEVIVADNASTDRTAEIARARGCAVVRVEKRVIGAARNAGAAAARGEVVAFVDADTRIHPGTFDAIDRALASDRIVGGATGVTLDRWSPGRAVAYAMLLPLVWITRFDTGVVFCRSTDFEEIGGYAETMLIAEDVRFLHALRRLGRTRRQRLTRPAGVKATASTRKFDEHGEWHFVTTMPRFLVGFALGRPSVLREIERYWYQPRR